MFQSLLKSILTISLILIFSSIIIAVLITLWVSLKGEEYCKFNEEISVFECGYDRRTNSRNHFSLRFFFVIILFLVFDIEILLLTPILIINLWYRFNRSVFLSSLLILIIFAGLLHEWKEGCLDWV